MNRDLKLGILAFITACILTGIYGCHLTNRDEQRKQVHQFQYTVVHIDPLSNCEYVAYRKDTNEMWTIVAHRGDCQNCATNSLHKQSINILSK